MPVGSSGNRVHPHVPRFFQGFVIAVVLGMVALLIWSQVAEEDAPAPGEVLALMEEGRYKAAAKAIDALLDQGNVLLDQGRSDEARAVFEEARDAAHEAQERVMQALAQTGAAGSTQDAPPPAGRPVGRDKAKVPFSLREAEACYFLAGMAFRRLRARYAEELARSTPEERFVPPPEETEPIREQILRGLEADDTHKELLRLQGVLDNMTGRFASAERALRKAIDLDPQFAEAYNDLAFVLLNLKQPQRARECFEKALLIAEDDPAVETAANYNLGRYHESLYLGYARGATEADAQKAAEHRTKAVEHLRTFLQKSKAGSVDTERARQAIERLEGGL